MNRLNRFNPLLWSSASALIALAAQPAMASMTSITDVQLNPTDAGVDIVFSLDGGDASNIFTVNQGNVLRADITRTQLDLPNGNEFRQANPAPGIAEISVIPLDANSVRVTISGTDSAPVGEVASSGNRVVMSVSGNGAAVAQQPTPVPEAIETVPGPEQPDVVAQADEPSVTPAEGVPEPDPDAIVPTEAEPVVPATQQAPEVLVPNPEVIIDGQPVPQPSVREAPPFLPRAVAPPVGDIAVAETAPTFSQIDLGTNERIPKLLLRDASSREVLALLARAAGLNLVFTNVDEEGGEAAATGGPPVTLDIEDESVQDVFNHVLRVTGLEANRVGRTIYVGPALPVSAQSITARTLRMNQVDATVAANFLVALGAESAVSRERLVTNVNAVEVAEGAPALTETQTTTVEQIETNRVDYEDSQAILRGLQVIADERTNSVTLVGNPTLIAIATEQLTRIDVRRRQVAINLKVIDVDLNALDAFGTSFSFAAGNTDFIQSGGVGVINFGSGTAAPAGAQNIPGSAPLAPQTQGILNEETGILEFLGNGPFAIVSSFILQLQATIQNGNAKILTDPTLIVQEGQTATVELTQEVPTDVTSEVVTSGNTSQTTVNVEFEPAGLILQIDVDRIDDNGFVSLSVAPSITAPTDTFTINGPNFSNTVFLLNNRQLSSGQVRVRDGQTLLLSGIIQESERSSVNKIPILGDIPILGALFRSRVNENQRQELIVLLTPQILDDSDQSVFGYSYTPSEEIQEILDNR